MAATDQGAYTQDGPALQSCLLAGGLAAGRSHRGPDAGRAGVATRFAPDSKTMTASPTLSAHGAAIPALGFGTSPMTGGLAPDTVVTALKAGYRHIDTAWKYGTERAVGEAMRAAGVPRPDIFLTTKVSHEYLRADAFARSVDESLNALQVDCVDLLLVHWPNPEIALSETMPALAKAKRQGLARHIGVANFNIALLDQAIKLCPEPLA